MFSSGKPTQKRDDNLNEDALIASLREYVSKNKSLPDFFTDVKSGSEIHKFLLNELNQALSTGDSDAVIFNHPDCLKYLLYLIEAKELPYWEGMSAYVFVIALAQFTDRQHLREVDKDVEDTREVQTHRLAADGKLTEFGREYLHKLITNMADYGFMLDPNELEKYVCSLKPFEQQVIDIEIKQSQGNGKGRSEADTFMTVLQRDIAFCTSNRDNSIFIPSMSVMQHIYAQMGADNMQMKPILGSISESTLSKLHKKNQHPVAIYSDAVKSNLKTVHLKRCGPIPALLHDIGHIFWANLISDANRDFIQHKLIPALESKFEDCKAQGIPTEASEMVGFRLNDYNLTALAQFRNRYTNALNHIQRIFYEQLISPNYIDDENKALQSSVEKQFIIDALKELNADNADEEELINNLTMLLQGSQNTNFKMPQPAQPTAVENQDFALGRKKHINIISVDFLEHASAETKSSALNETHGKFINHLCKSIDEHKYNRVTVMVGSNHQDPDSDKLCHNISNFKKHFELHTELAQRVDRNATRVVRDDYLLADTFSAQEPGATLLQAITCQDETGRYKPKEYQEQHLSDLKAPSDHSRLQTVYAQIHRAAINNPGSMIDFDFYGWDEHATKVLHGVFKNNPDLIPNNVRLCVHKYSREHEYSISDSNELVKKEKGQIIHSFDKIQGVGKVDCNYQANLVLMAKCSRDVYPNHEYYKVAFNIAYTFNQRPKTLERFKRERDLVGQAQLNQSHNLK